MTLEEVMFSETVYLIITATEINKEQMNAKN